MKQSKKGSLVETLTNVSVGYFIAILTQFLVFPLFGLKVTIGNNMMIGLIFTVVSIIRSYGVRRLYNHYGWFVK